MGQGDVLNFLEKNKGKRYSVLMISEGIGLTHGSVCDSVRRLRKHNQKNLRFKIENNPYVYWWED